MSNAVHCGCVGCFQVQHAFFLPAIYIFSSSQIFPLQLFNAHRLYWHAAVTFLAVIAYILLFLFLILILVLVLVFFAAAESLNAQLTRQTHTRRAHTSRYPSGELLTLTRRTHATCKLLFNSIQFKAEQRISLPRNRARITGFSRGVGKGGRGPTCDGGAAVGGVCGASDSNGARTRSQLNVRMQLLASSSSSAAVLVFTFMGFADGQPTPLFVAATTTLPACLFFFFLAFLCQQTAFCFCFLYVWPCACVG